MKQMKLYLKANVNKLFRFSDSATILLHETFEVLIVNKFMTLIVSRQGTGLYCYNVTIVTISEDCDVRLGHHQEGRTQSLFPGQRLVSCIPK